MVAFGVVTSSHKEYYRVGKDEENSSYNDQGVRAPSLWRKAKVFRAICLEKQIIGGENNGRFKNLCNHFSHSTRSLEQQECCCPPSLLVDFPGASDWPLWDRMLDLECCWNIHVNFSPNFRVSSSLFLRKTLVILLGKSWEVKHEEFSIVLLFTSEFCTDHCAYTLHYVFQLFPVFSPSAFPMWTCMCVFKKITKKHS